MGNQSVKGLIISRNEINEYLKQPPGIRMREIRLKLDGLYPGEFNLKKVAEEAKFSENGLAKAETGNTDVQKATIELAEGYYAKFNVPVGFFEKKPVSTMKPFYLGKPADMMPYFDHFYEAHGQKHFLDKRELPDIERTSDYNYYQGSFDINQYDVIEGDDGGPLLDRIGVEVSISAYQVSTGIPLWDKRLNDKTVISPQDIFIFEKALRRDVDVLVSRFGRIFATEEQLKESQMRETFLKAQLYLQKQEHKTEADSDLERELKALLDELK